MPRADWAGDNWDIATFSGRFNRPATPGTTLGNWIDQRDDLAPVAGVFNDAGDTLDSRTHDQANQLTQRVIKNGSETTVLATLPLGYDPAGNMRQESFRDEPAVIKEQRRYTHDAWGRLVKVERLPEGNGAVWADLSVSKYNGLHWRTERSYTVENAAGGTAARAAYYMYDASWRVVEELQADTAAGTTTLTLLANLWGARYIDDLIARVRMDLPAGTTVGSVGTSTLTPSLTTVFHTLTDAQFSVVAILGTGVSAPADRIGYSPYGIASFRMAADVYGWDGADTKDTEVVMLDAGIEITKPEYDADYDMNRDGVIDDADIDFVSNQEGAGAAVLVGWLGDNRALAGGPRRDIGYCGYVFNEKTSLDTVRFRNCLPLLGLGPCD